MKVAGSNYYSVKSAAEFKKRLDTEFEYMVTPLVFDLTVKFEAVGYEIEKVTTPVPHAIIRYHISNITLRIILGVWVTRIQRRNWRADKGVNSLSFSSG